MKHELNLEFIKNLTMKFLNVILYVHNAHRLRSCNTNRIWPICAYYPKANKSWDNHSLTAVCWWASSKAAVLLNYHGHQSWRCSFP